MDTHLGGQLPLLHRALLARVLAVSEPLVIHFNDRGAMSCRRPRCQGGVGIRDHLVPGGSITRLVLIREPVVIDLKHRVRAAAFARHRRTATGRPRVGRARGLAEWRRRVAMRHGRVLMATGEVLIERVEGSIEGIEVVLAAGAGCALDRARIWLEARLLAEFIPRRHHGRARRSRRRRRTGGRLPVGRAGGRRHQAPRRRGRLGVLEAEEFSHSSNHGSRL